MNQEPLEQKLIQLTQSGLPIESRPFLKLSQELGINEQQVIDVLASMKERGIIRRIGAVPNHYAIGYVFNLMTVWDINDSDIDQVGERVGALEFVSHCYQRPRHANWPYNFFAMVHGRNDAEVKGKMKQIEILVDGSCQQFTALKSTKILKKTGVRI